MNFTIAIPTYNNEDTIEDAINSAINQSYEGDYEVLVVNNNSSDKTLETVNGYVNERIRVVSNSSTCTLFENHNVCLRKARGDYIIFCHSDDKLDCQALSILERKIKVRGYPKKYIAWGHSLFRDFSSSLDNSSLERGKIFAGIVAVRPFINSGLTPSGTCYSKSFIDIGGFLHTNYHLTPSDSSSMIWAALNGFRFEMLDEMLFYRIDASTATRAQKPKNTFEPFIDAWTQLVNVTNTNQNLDLIQQTRHLKHMNPILYLFMADKYPRLVLKEILISFLKEPLIARRSIFWKAFWKAVQCCIKT
jgi:glycosyltransferase involved in cell wall biosynthesis